MTIEFNSFEQFEEIKSEAKKDKVTLKTKKGQDVVFTIMELDPEQFFNLQDIAADFEVKDGEVQGSKGKQFLATIKMFTASVVNDKNERICDNDKAVEYIKRSFDLGELVKAVEKVLDISGLSKESINKTEKN